VSRAGTTTRDRLRSRRDRTAAARDARGRARAARRGASAPVTPLTRRRGTGRRPRRRRPLQVAFGLLILAALAWLLWFGPVLAVRTVQVDGVSTLTADEVRRSAAVDEGTPLLRVDVEAAEARVAALPQVAAVEVTRGWPSSVVITVVERVPVAVVGEPGRRSLVDDEGVLFDTVSGDAPDGVVPLDVAAPGPDDPATMAVLAAIDALPADVRDDVASAAATGADDISLTLTDDTVVLWGSAEESDKKASVLVALMEQIGAGSLEPAGTIDISAPDAVVLR
jgi:cell division protein FtsQ